MNTQEMEAWIHEAVRVSRESGEAMIRNNETGVGQAALEFSKDLQGAIKFFVPDRSFNEKRRVSILRSDAPLEDFADLIGSPYPVWALVYRVRSDDPESIGDKRVVLVRETESDLRVEVAVHLPHADESEPWAYLPGTAFFKKRDPSVFEKMDGGRKLSIGFEMPPSAMFTSSELYQMAQESIDDCFVVIETLILLGIDNGVKREVKHNATVNRRREAKGKRRFFDYWVLDVPSAPASGDGYSGGAHSSPRFHLRRGHLRRLATGAVTWVRATTVGKASAGLVVKDYAVSR